MLNSLSPKGGAEYKKKCFINCQQTTEEEHQPSLVSDRSLAKLELAAQQSYFQYVWTVETFMNKIITDSDTMHPAALLGKIIMWTAVMRNCFQSVRMMRQEPSSSPESNSQPFL